MTRVMQIPDGFKGFDCNSPLTTVQAHAFVASGYRFAARYIRRSQAHAYDLTAKEAITLLGAGLAILPVQHVESAESWVPSATKGAQYGQTAADEAKQAGIPAGVSVVCDLEGVAPGTDHQVVIDYLKQWYAPVRAAGFHPALYVGWHCGLTAEELYFRIPFARYWSAYNLNADQMPAKRGVCLKQRAAKPSERPAGVPFEIDADTAMADALGGRLTVVAPDEWGVLG